jgi:hypothetical protein
VAKPFVGECNTTALMDEYGRPPDPPPGLRTFAIMFTLCLLASYFLKIILAA